jgi:hypothetical protein
MPDRIDLQRIDLCRSVDQSKVRCTEIMVKQYKRMVRQYKTHCSVQWTNDEPILNNVLFIIDITGLIALHNNKMFLLLSFDIV